MCHFVVFCFFCLQFLFINIYSFKADFEITKWCFAVKCQSVKIWLFLLKYFMACLSRLWTTRSRATCTFASCIQLNGSCQIDSPASIDQIRIPFILFPFTNGHNKCGRYIFAGFCRCFNKTDYMELLAPGQHLLSCYFTLVSRHVILQRRKRKYTLNSKFQWVIGSDKTK